MYGASGIPELIPPSGPPRQPGPRGAVQPGTPPGQRPRRRAQPSETRTEGTQTGSDWSVQESGPGRRRPG